MARANILCGAAASTASAVPLVVQFTDMFFEIMWNLFLMQKIRYLGSLKCQDSELLFYLQ